MKVATDTRFGKPYLDSSMKGKVNNFGTNRDYSFIDIKSEAIPKNVVALYKKLLLNGYSPDEIQILSAKNVHECGAWHLNTLIQPIANPNYGSRTHVKVGDTVYFKGDIIMQTKNNYKAEVYTEDPYEEPHQTFIANGETGKITRIKGNDVIIDFDGTLVRYTKGSLIDTQLAYAISVHKSQGSAFNIVILCTPRQHTFTLTSNLLYVGLTRMRTRCYHLGEINAVNIAVKKKEDKNRRTFMLDFLVHDIQ